MSSVTRKNRIKEAQAKTMFGDMIIEQTKREGTGK
jgi:hypothetical protein